MRSYRSSGVQELQNGDIGIGRRDFILGVAVRAEGVTAVRKTGSKRERRSYRSSGVADRARRECQL